MSMGALIGTSSRGQHSEAKMPSLKLVDSKTDDRIDRHIHRADLHRGLLECAVELGCVVFLDSRVISIDPYTPSLVVKGGKTYTGDLIVASDGTSPFLNASLKP